MEMRLKFNENPNNYDKYRPDYPKELFQDIISYSRISLESKALEIGIGTGQATSPILNTGCDVTAVELGENLASRSIYDKYRPTDKKIVEFSLEDCKKYIDELNKCGFKDLECKLYKRMRTLTTEEYIGLLNTYSEHPTPLVSQKDDFEREMREAINSVGGKVNIYDTIDLYLARKG